MIREPLRSVLVLGLLFVSNLFFFGGPGQIVRYSGSPIHREVSSNLLKGKLSLPYAVGPEILANDLEVRNGSWFTHWGYGVPLLQAPFHLFGIFPDRLIFFLFLCGVTAGLFFSFRKWLSEPVTAGLATASVLSFSHYWLISFRFSVYEQTVAYSSLVQLAALAIYLRDPTNVRAIGSFAGIGILVRPIGFIFAGLWGFLLRKNWKGFSLSLLPFLILFGLFNLGKSGSLFSLGLQNSIPFYPDHLLPVRFGVRCGTILEHFIVFFRLLFIGPVKEIAECGFRIEGHEAAPFLGWFSLVTVGSATGYLFYRRTRSDLLAWVAAFGAMLGIFSWAGMGFSDRYAADFAPVLVIGAAVCLVQGIKELQRLPRFFLSGFFALVFFAGSYRTLEKYDRFVATTSSHESLEGEQAPGQDLPSKLNHLTTVGYRRGWDKNTETAAITEFFIGMPNENKSDWRLVLTGPNGNLNMEKVYINGDLYRPEGDAVPFRLDPPSLSSKNILVSILWGQGTTPNLLLEAEIQ